MKTIAILGAGTGGTIMANKLRRHLDAKRWKIVIIDKEDIHYYQPGYIFIPFNINRPQELVRRKSDFIPKGVEFIQSEIELIDAEHNRVTLKDNSQIAYDFLIIATGVELAPEETEGLKGEGWYRNVFDFYTLEGAVALQKFLQPWQGGRLVVNIVEMPIKCPVAPLEISFLADWWLRKNGLRNKVEIVYATPLSGAFTKPVAAQLLGDMLEKKDIKVVAEFNTGAVDETRNVLISYDGQEIPYDLLITVPLNKGNDVIERSGIGDELNYVPTEKHTLKAKNFPNIFVIGDATDLPTSKAGSVAHFQADVLTENMLRIIKDQPLKEAFDGHANCFIETGYHKGMLIDFNYEVEPLPGLFPFPVIGPMQLLKETRMNHWGKLLFRWVYWNILLKGLWLPVPTKMSRAGKKGL